MKFKSLQRVPGTEVPLPTSKGALSYGLTWQKRQLLYWNEQGINIIVKQTRVLNRTTTPHPTAANVEGSVSLTQLYPPAREKKEKYTLLDQQKARNMLPLSVSPSRW